MIGFGRFGRLLVRHAAKDFRVHVFDRVPQRRRIRALGGVPAALEEACRQDIVVFCVPIRALGAALRQAARFIRADAAVIDVCSVKEYPARVMRRTLPRTVEILATHPTFGPDSAAETLKDRKIALCRVRMGRKRYACIKGYLARKGLKVVEVSPREHDRQMALTLALTHFIGRGLIRFGADHLELDTEGYRRLMRILQTVQNDSWELFEDMNKYNAFARRARVKFLKSLREIDRKV